MYRLCWFSFQYDFSPALQRRNYSELKSSYNDLLELLAQQELEIQVFRGRVGVVGVKVLEDAEAEVRRLAIDKYGAYTNFRG